MYWGTVIGLDYTDMTGPSTGLSLVILTVYLRAVHKQLDLTFR